MISLVESMKETSLAIIDNIINGPVTDWDADYFSIYWWSLLISLTCHCDLLFSYYWCFIFIGWYYFAWVTSFHHHYHWFSFSLSFIISLKTMSSQQCILQWGASDFNNTHTMVIEYWQWSNVSIFIINIWLAPLSLVYYFMINTINIIIIERCIDYFIITLCRHITSSFLATCNDCQYWWSLISIILSHQYWLFLIFIFIIMYEEFICFLII